MNQREDLEMSKFHFQLDKALLENNKLIGDERIRTLLNKGKPKVSNPNESIYVDCQLSFEERENSILKNVLGNVQQFDFDLDTKEEEERPILGPYYIIDDESMYIGQFNGDVRQGRGILIYNDGCYYEGYFDDNETSRRGRLIFADGDMYLGELKNNSMCGQGVYFKKDGSKYTGTFLADAPEGEGREEWQDGAHFQGHYLKGSKHGHGVFCFANKTKYTGEFKNDLFWGKGELMRGNGTKYIGNWAEGVLKSPVTIISPEGKIYRGEIKEMNQHGKGELEDHGTIFKGDFVDGKLEGEVRIEYANGAVKLALYSKGNLVKWIKEIEAPKKEAKKKPKKKPCCFCF